ncbi:MAG: hypothetical protein EAZ97_04185 [Bacteroidetes bacterium]|nr:MAG: hypothetical protein EAZ97_04185 [Bacteroidota bacterium]
MKILLCILVLCLNLKAFSQNSPNELNKFASDAMLRQIYEYQDRRMTDSLKVFFKHENPIYRQMAAQAFGSVQDSAVIEDLEHLLKDPDKTVRIATAYALGQIGSVLGQRWLVEYFENENDNEVRVAMLEAIGKCSDGAGVEFLFSQQFEEENMVYGLVLGLYRSLQHGHSLPAKSAKIIGFLKPEMSDRIRILAAVYLARNPRKEDYERHINQIFSLLDDKNPFVRMNVALALGKTVKPEVLTALKKVALNDKSHLVRISTLRSLGNFDIMQTKNIFIDALNDPNNNVTFTASEMLLKNTKKESGIDFQLLVKKTKNLRARANLMAAAVKLDKENAAVKIQKNSKITQWVKDYLAKTKNIYEEGYILKALSENVNNYEWIAETMAESNRLPLLTEAMLALVHLRKNPDFDLLSEEDKKNFDKILRFGIESNNPALMAISAEALRNPKWNYEKRFPDFEFLKRSQDSLQLPEDTETYVELQKTIDYFQGIERTENLAPEFNHPIDWDKVVAIDKAKKVQVKTKKGKFVMELFVEDAPATVLSFLELTKHQFYNDKTFHRVVPNFVVQGGCPRGDGYGSVHYSLRSEFAPLNYLEGYVGMASSGKDTEGCQWFITHTPSPHLDGKYTIFGKVISGMEVVHQLEVGDLMEEVKVIEK